MRTWKGSKIEPEFYARFKKKKKDYSTLIFESVLQPLTFAKYFHEYFMGE